MRFDVITLFPEMIEHVSRFGVTGRALKHGQVSVICWNPRDFAHDRHRSVDDRPYGGGPGMVMKCQPVRDAIQAAQGDDRIQGRVIYLSPQGRPLDQRAVTRFAALKRLILVSGRYEGIDERLVDSEIDEEWSIGDYVLSGGELAALVVVDAVSRLLPGVLHHEESAKQDSHVAGLLDHPHYTRPEEFEGQSVPEVLLSGDHQAIERWRMQQSLGRTWLRRPELLEKLELSAEQRTLLEEFQRDQKSKGK